MGAVEITMNVLELVRNKILKTQRLHDAQFLMAKAYRGVPYVDAHHDQPTDKGEQDDHKQLTYRGNTYER
ncbi:DUF4278 domain-containing protein [Cyanobium sp. NIES-981]|uniref:DUF4278 domain-containing protein n=1 Tax=Cyanobium sp. NIES-981 TaxID=1851505 RepID=UPI0007DD0881|nr:DUF4278 domain-containing protein [Cyanobium sp. NIES-981]SBO43710.1 conserved protein of unknown function [Cyanobium sp. NIES-981]